jgi:hypothetical protein
VSSVDSHNYLDSNPDFSSFAFVGPPSLVPVGGAGFLCRCRSFGWDDQLVIGSGLGIRLGFIWVLPASVGQTEYKRKVKFVDSE